MNDSTPAPELDPAFVFGPTPLEAESARCAAAWAEVVRAGRLLDELAAERLEPCPFSGFGPALNSGDVEVLEARHERTLALMAMGDEDDDDTPPPAAPLALPVLWELEGAAA